MRQISVSLPDLVYKEGRKYAKKFGYRNIQDVMVDLLRRNLFGDEVAEYRQISKEMSAGKNVVRFETKKDALEFLEAI